MYPDVHVAQDSLPGISTDPAGHAASKALTTAPLFVPVLATHEYVDDSAETLGITNPDGQVCARAVIVGGGVGADPFNCPVIAHAVGN